MSVTLQDIADATGADRSTVSRVLRGLAGRYQIGAQRVETIQAAARHLGYRPNASARATRTGRFDRVGLLMRGGTENVWMPPELLDGIHRGLVDHGLSLQICHLPELPDGAGQYPPFIEERMLDGLIVMGRLNFPESLTQVVASMRLPMIWSVLPRPFDSVYVDNYAGGVQAAQHFLVHGYRRLAILGGRPATENDRVRGYLDTAAAAGAEAHHIEHPHHVIALQSDAADPLAVASHGRDYTPCLLVECLRAGLRLPQDIALLEFHNGSPTASACTIDTLVIDETERARQVVAMLLAKLAAPATPIPAVVLTPTLIPRGTVAPRKRV